MMYVLRIPAGAIIWCQFMHMSTYKSWKQRLQTRKKALFDSRPLTEVSSSSNDLEAITPNRFLISRVNPVPPCVVFTDKEIFCLERYLPTLIERKKKKTYHPANSVNIDLGRRSLRTDVSSYFLCFARKRTSAQRRFESCSRISCCFRVKPGVKQRR